MHVVPQEGAGSKAAIGEAICEQVRAAAYLWLAWLRIYSFSSLLAILEPLPCSHHNVQEACFAAMPTLIRVAGVAWSLQAEALHAAAVVVVSHSHGGLAEFIRGSVADYLVHNCSR